MSVIGIGRSRIVLAGLLVGLMLLVLGSVAAQEDAAAGQQAAQDDTGGTGESTEEQFLEEPTVTPEPTPLILAPVVAPTAEPIEQTGPWSIALNLSRSGSTTGPQVVVDSISRYHVLWRDAIDGFVYITGDGANWSVPVVPELPFASRRNFFDLPVTAETPRFSPLLLADGNGAIHAFWLDTVSGETPWLYYSQVAAGSFTNYDAWWSPTRLDTAAAAPTAVVDAAGRVHVAYLRTSEDGGGSAGVYYQQLAPGTQTWSNRAVLYQSRYLRGLEMDAGLVSMATRDNGRVGIAWSDPRREQIFFTQSPDAGASWDVPIEVDRRAPEDPPGAIGPRGISLGSLPNGWLLTWGAGHERGRECTQYSRSYSDTAGTWSLHEPMDDLAGCLTTAQFLGDGERLFLMGATTAAAAGQTGNTTTPFLLAWDGSRWSLPQVQEPLRVVTNIETNQTAQLSCYQGLARDGLLNVVACDTGTGGDIWWQSRPLGDSAEWFPPEPIWAGPDRVASSEGTPLDLQLVADGQGSTHAFWRVDGGSEIYHMRWDGDRWSSAFPVLTGGNGALEALAAAAYADRLYLVGRDRTGIFFSQALATRPTEWSAPLPLDPARPGAVSPDILVDNSGLIVVYAMPLNEQRGIYMTRSSGNGIWSEPRMIFDGTTAAWEMVDQPQLVKTRGGELHLTILRRGLPPDAQTQALAYSRSTSDGTSWSEVIALIERPIAWNHLVAVGDRILHRLWIEEANGRAVVWHAQSIDDGLTWAQASQLTGLDEGEEPAVTVDPLGRVHLLALNGGRLLNWVWDGQAWSPDESLTTSLADGGLLAAAADVEGRLAAVYAGVLPGVTDAAAGRELFAMSRLLDVPAAELPQPPTLTPTPIATAAPESTPTPGPTPTLVLPIGQDSGPLSGVPGASSQAGQIALALIPALLVVGVVTAVGVRAVRMGRR